MAVAASKLDIGEAACITGIPGTTEAEAQAKDSAGSTNDILDLLEARGIPESILGHLRLLPVRFFFNFDALTDEDLVALGVGVQHPLHRRRFLVELKHVLAQLAEQASLHRTTRSVSNPGSCSNASSKGKRLKGRPQSASLSVGCGERPGPVIAGAAAKARPASACSAASAPESALRLGGKPAALDLATMPGNPRYAILARAGSSGQVRRPSHERTQRIPPAGAANQAGYRNSRWPYVDLKTTKKGAEVEQPAPKPPPRPRGAGRAYARYRKEKTRKRTSFIDLHPAHTPAEVAAFVTGSSPLEGAGPLFADSVTEQGVLEQSFPGLDNCSDETKQQQQVQESGRETPYIDSESWLEYRLMPGGPLAIIEALRRAAVGGDVELLRGVIQKAEIHGPSFLKCIDSQPVSCRLPGSDNAHKEPQKVLGLWTWASHRLDELGRAESELSSLVETGLRALQNARRLAPKQDETLKMSTAMGVDRNRQGTPEILQQDPSSVAFRGVDSSPGSSTSPSSPNGNLQTTPDSWTDVNVRGMIRDVIKLRTAKCFDKAVNPTSFLSAQTKLMEATQRLRSHVRVVDESVALEGPIRNQAAAILVQLQDCQEDLFDRFVVFRKHVESELWAASDFNTDGADRILTLRRLRAAISTARQEVGATTLIGEAAVAWAEKHGIGIYQKYGEDKVEPPSPWSNIKTRQPPWEASYKAAVTRLLEMSQQPGEEETSFQEQRTAFDAQEVSFVRHLQAANMLEAPYERKTIDAGSRRGAVVRRVADNETIEAEKLPTEPAEDEVASPKMRIRPKLRVGFSNVEKVALALDSDVEEDAELFKPVRNKPSRAKTVSFGSVAEEVIGCPGRFFERDSVVGEAGW